MLQYKINGMQLQLSSLKRENSNDMLALKSVDILSTPTTYAAQETHNMVNTCTE